MTVLTDDEVALLRSLLTALRSIKIRDIDKALVILAKSDRLAATHRTVTQSDPGAKL